MFQLIPKHYVKNKNEIRGKYVVHVYTVLGVGNYIDELACKYMTSAHAGITPYNCFRKQFGITL